MNSVNLTGRFTRNPEIKYTDGGTSIARFTLAVERRFKQEGGANADFVRCVAFGKTAEFIEKWFGQGNKMEVSGRIQTGFYEKDGTRIYTTDVVAENVGFAESKSASQRGGQTEDDNGFGQPDPDGFMNIPDGIEEELPFN